MVWGYDQRITASTRETVITTPGARTLRLEFKQGGGRRNELCRTHVLASDSHKRSRAFSVRFGVQLWGSVRKMSPRISEMCAEARRWVIESARTEHIARQLHPPVSMWPHPIHRHLLQARAAACAPVSRDQALAHNFGMCQEYILAVIG